MLLCELPGYSPPKGATRGEPQLTLPDLEKCFREFLLGTYHRREHGDTRMPPQERWDKGSFLPQMPDTLEQLDLLLLTVAEVRVFYQGRFLCRAICQELAGETVPLREILRARNHRRKELRRTIQDRQRTVDALLELRRWTPAKEDAPPGETKTYPEPPRLKRYFNE